MGKFQIDGQWYEAPNYAAARELHKARKGTISSPSTTKVETLQLKQPPPVNLQISNVEKLQLDRPPSLQLATSKGFQVKPPELPSPKPSETTDTSLGTFELACYRGEKNNWWNPPTERLIYGMTLYQPWNLLAGINTMKKLWEHLLAFMQKNCFGKVDAFAQYLRATGRPFAVATARTTAGSFTSDYNYVIKVPNARTFKWGPKLTLGEKVNFDSTDSIDADYIVLNAETIEDSTLLAFGHNCGTYEVTFLHDLNIRYIHSVNGELISSLKMKDTTQLSFDDKIKLRKYIRRPNEIWLNNR